MRKIPLHWQILAALVLAVVFGLVLGSEGSWFGYRVNYVACYGFIGTMFLNALKMLIVPLIASAIITGVAEIGTTVGFARLGAKTLVYYMSSSLVAILIGLVLVNIIRPGLVNGEPAKDLVGFSADTQQVVSQMRGTDASDIVGVFLRLVPDNIVGAAVETKMLGIITFSILFGFFLSRSDPEKQSVVLNFFQGLFDVMIRMTHFVILFTPIGVFGLVARTVATTGMSSFGPVMGFFVTVIVGLAIHACIALPLAIWLFVRVNPWRHFRAMEPALLMAFSTSSSSATLPCTLECVVENAGVSKKVTSFTLPLGATVNMDGTALYECVAAMFIAQCYGVDLGFWVQFTVVLTALLTSVGVAGIPSASLVAIVVILSAIGLPAEGIGLILVVDRLLDMGRTAVNVWSDSAAALIIARSEGETELLVDVLPDTAPEA